MKAQTAREGITVREVAVSLFEQWLRQRKQPPAFVPTVDWQSFQPPLAQFVREGITDHSVNAMRESTIRRWDERS